MRRAYDVLGLQCPTTAAGGAGVQPTGLLNTAPGQTPGNITRPGVGVRMVGPGANTAAMTPAGLTGVRMLAPPQGQPAPNVSLPLDSTQQAQQTTSGVPTPQGQQSAATSIQLPNASMQLFGSSDGQAQPGIVSSPYSFRKLFFILALFVQIFQGIFFDIINLSTLFAALKQ